MGSHGGAHGTHGPGPMDPLAHGPIGPWTHWPMDPGPMGPGPRGPAYYICGSTLVYIYISATVLARLACKGVLVMLREVISDFCVK